MCVAGEQFECVDHTVLEEIRVGKKAALYPKL